MSAEPQPLLVIVSGSPASGKSSLAIELARRLGLPLISRDDIKEAIMDVIPVEDADRSHQVGEAAFLAMYRVLDRLLDAQLGAVLESTFQPGRSERDLNRHIDRTRAIQVHCHADAATLKHRLAERIASGTRHEGHQDNLAHAEIESALANGDYDPLELGIPVLMVDTSNDQPPDLAGLVDAIRRLLR